MTKTKYVALFFLLALDCFFNWFPLLGSFFESMSARAARMRDKKQPVWGWTANAIDILWFWEPNHCAAQLEREKLHGGAWGAFLVKVRQQN